MNNREIASLIWLAVGLAAALFSGDIRSALWAVVKSFVQPKIVGPILLLAAWVTGLVVIAHGLALWEADERGDTIVWFITVGIAFYFSLDKTKQDDYFRKTALHAVAATVFVEGFVNLAVFGLAVELLIAPVVAFLVVLGAVADQTPEHAPVGRLVSGVLSIIGVVFFLLGRAIRHQSRPRSCRPCLGASRMADVGSHAPHLPGRLGVGVRTGVHAHRHPCRRSGEPPSCQACASASGQRARV